MSYLNKLRAYYYSHWIPTHSKRKHAVKLYARDFYIGVCLTAQMMAGYLLMEYYLYKTITVKGPSMLPTIDTKDNIVFVDQFTTKFLRQPKKGEIILADNPFKDTNTIIKRVMFLEGEYADFFDQRTEEYVKVRVPHNHIWVEGDNKANSRDSREFGPLSLELVHGIVRYKTDDKMEDSKSSPTPLQSDLTATVSMQSDYEASSSVVTYILDLVLKIQENIDNKYEDIDRLRELNYLLNTHRFSIVAELTTDPLNKKDKLDFYKKVFKTTADKMLAEKVLSQPGILRFFRNILVNFFPLDITEESLAEIVHSLFNLEASLYTIALQTNQRKQLANNQDLQSSEVDFEDLSLDQKRVRLESSWRQSLKVGDRLDAVLSSPLMHFKISHWAKATITTQLDSDQFYVTFDGYPAKGDRLVNRLGFDIAPIDTFTDDFDWRYQLKPDDLVDAIDSEAVWYRSTCLDERFLNYKLIEKDDENDESEEPENQKEVKEMYVAFRIYDDEQGHKIDEEGRKYIGWSEKYDFWMPATSPTIQKLNTLCKWYKTATKATMIYDNYVDDLQDISFNTKERKVWGVFRNNFFSNLRCIPDYFNEFGERGGFQGILDFLGDISKQKTLKHVYFLMDFLSKSCPLWHRQFAFEFIPALREAFERGILHTNSKNTGPTQLKFTKDSLLGVQKAFQNILRRYYPQDEYNTIVALFNFNVGFSLLKSEKLEQRIQGLKEVVDQVKGTKFSNRKALNSKEVINKLKQENIFNTIFGDNYHIQLIQRSMDIIKFYVNEKEITEKEIDYIWQATKKDQQTKMEIYKIISDIALMFRTEENEMLVDRFSQVPAEHFVEKEIECVYELSKYCYRHNSISIKAAQLFWEIATQERPYKKHIIEMAIDKFIELVRNWERDNKVEYILKGIERIHDGKSSVVAIKIIQKLLDGILSYRVNNQPTLFETSNQLLKEHDLINRVIYDLIDYEERINELWSKGVLNENNIDTIEVLDLPFSHRSQSFIRLNFIRQMLQNAQIQLEQEQLDQIWDVMMVRSKVSIDSDIFFHWLKQMLSDNNKLSPELIVHFFQTKVCSADANFKYIKKAGFDCICNIFLNINGQEEKIQVVSLPNYSNSSGSQKLDFKVLVPPEELSGMETIWKLLQECDKKNNDVTSVVIDLITKIYHFLSTNLCNQVHQIEDQFCHESLSRLRNILLDESISDEEKKQFTKMMTLMMKSFFQDSEKNGMGNLRNHLALDKGEFLNRVVIQNNVTSLKNTPKFIELNVYSNMTIWQLKSIVADKLQQSPLRIQFNRQDQKKKQITDNDHACTLKEFRIESYELIYAQKKPAVFTSRVALTNKKRELVPEAKAIFEHWFDKFSDEDGFMTPLTCIGFIKYCTNDPNVEQNDSRIVRLFTDYDQDQDGKLTKEEYVEFYRERALQKPELVWSNLSTNGYSNDLRPTNSLYSKDDPNEIKDPSVLPRYKMSNDPQMFQELFQLIAQQPQVSEELWLLIGSLRTNNLIYSSIMALSDIDRLVNNTVSIYQLLYNLQIIESFINEYQVKQNTEMKCYYLESQDYQENFPSLNEQDQTNVISSDLNDNIREQQASAPQSGVAIPLPPAPPQFQDAETSNHPGPIGPVPPPQQNNANNISNQAQKIKELLDSFKGHIIQTNLSNEIFSDEELMSMIGLQSVQEVHSLRQNWVQNFIQIGAFKILSQFLDNLNSYSKSQQDSQLLNSKSEKECLCLILKIMKVLLMSSFIGNAPNAELGLELSRKMSSKDYANGSNMNIGAQAQDNFGSSNTMTEANNGQGEQQKEEKKSVAQAEKDDFTSLYAPLTSLLIGDLGSQLLSSINFNQFQDQLLAIMKLILKKKDKINLDDRTIIEQAIGLWIGLIVYNSDLLQNIYDEYELSEQQVSGDRESAIRFLVEDGLLSTSYSIRETFRDNFKFIVLQVKTQTLSEQPYIFFLRVLLKSIDDTKYKSRDSKQYFTSLRTLLTIYFNAQNSNSLSFKKLFETRDLLTQFVQRLIEYESKEKKTSYLEDTNLVGYLQIIQELIENDPIALTENEYSLLLTELMEKCLFTFEIQPIESHITKAIDIQEHEKRFINKALCAESRIAAFNLLEVICKIQPQMSRDIIEKYWYPLAQKVKKPKKMGYAPRTEGKSFYGYSGIKNLGCICYMNAMIQQFFHIPTFRYCLLSTNDKQPLNMQPFEGELVDDNMLHQLMKFMGFLELSERQDYNPREFCFSFKDFAGQPTNVRIQQDSQEFLNLAFDRLENLLYNTPQKYLLQNIFGGKTCSLMICKSCGHLTQKQEEFYNLSLEVKNQKSIYDGLKKFISGEIINDYKCGACNQKVDIERKTAIDKLPNTLIVHLQRIVFDFDTMMNSKINSRVEFPNVLNLKPYMLSEVLKQEKDLLKNARKQKKKMDKQAQKQKDLEENQKQRLGEEGKNEQENEEIDTTMKMDQESPSKTEQDISSEDEEDQVDDMEIDEPEENFQYKLVGVIIHMGTADAGHYLSYINIERGKKSPDNKEWLETEKEKWLEFNDSSVKDWRFSNLEEDCFGGVNQSSVSGSDFKDYSKNAYMLIYDKRQKEKIKIVIPDEMINEQQQLSQSEALGCDGTAITRDNHLLNVCPQIEDSIKNNTDLIYDEEKKERYTLVEFNSAQKFVPNETYKMIHNDNHLFLCEKQVFSNQYFETSKKLVEHIIEKEPNLLSLQGDPFTDKLFSFMDRVIFDLTLLASENKPLLDLARLYTMMLNCNEEKTMALIKNRILVEKEKLEKDQRGFFEALIANMDRETRDLNGVILAYTVNKMFQINNEEMIETLMNQIFGFMPEELAKNWLKISQYLSFIFEIARSGYNQMSYLIKKGIVAKLIDFYLENDSPAMIGQMKKRQLMGSNYANPPLEIAILTLSYILRHYPNINMIGTVDEQQLSEERVETCYLYMPDFPTELPSLSQDDIFMINQKKFYEKQLKSGYERLEFGRLVAHLSFNNYNFSRRVCKRILVGINKASSDEIEPYLHSFVLVLNLSDKFQDQRIEWLLGIPHLRIDRPVLYQNQQNEAPYKVGACIIDSANDDILEYRSTLFKINTTVKESYLAMLYSYRKRWSKYTLSCLIALIQTCLQDPSGKVFNYLKTMDPPSYIYTRYIDWIRPYINEQIESIIRTSSNSQSNNNDLTYAISALNSWDQLLGQKMPYLVKQPATQENPYPTIDASSQLIYDSNDGGPEPYILWNVQDERVIIERNLFEEKITVLVKEVKVRVTESRPDGKQSNSAFPKNMFSGIRTENPYQSNSQGPELPYDNYKVRKPQYARGQQRYSDSQQTSNGQRRPPHRGGNANQKKKKKKFIVTSATGNQDDQFEDRNESDDNEIDPRFKEENIEEQFTQDRQDYTDPQNQDDSMEVEYNNDNQNTDGYYNQDDGTNPLPQNDDEFSQQHDNGNAQDGMMDYQNNQDLRQEEQDHKDPQEITISNNEQKQYEQVSAVTSKDGIVPEVRSKDEPIEQDHRHKGEDREMPQQQQQDEENQQMQSNQQEEVNHEIWEISTQAIIIVCVVNHDEEKAQKVRLSFTDLSENFPLNFKLPKSAIPAQVMPNRERDVVIFTKLRPFDEWGLFDFDIQVIDNNNSNQNTNSNRPNISISQPQPNDQLYIDSGTGAGEWPSDDKECSTCTFINSSLLNICEMCGGRLM